MKNQLKKANYFFVGLNAVLVNYETQAATDMHLRAHYLSDLKHIDLVVQIVTDFFRKTEGINAAIKNLEILDSGIANDVESSDENVKQLMDQLFLSLSLFSLIKNTADAKKMPNPFKELHQRLQSQILIRKTGLKIIRDNQLLAFIHSLNRIGLEQSMFQLDHGQIRKNLVQIRKDILGLIEIVGSLNAGCEFVTFIEVIQTFLEKSNGIKGRQICNWEAPFAMDLLEQYMWLTFAELSSKRSLTAEDLALLIPSIEAIQKTETTFSPIRRGFAMMHAIQAGNREEVTQLLKEMDVNSYLPNEYTPLMTAAAAGQLEIVKLLVESGGAFLHMLSRNGSAIHRAASKKQYEVMAYLYSKGASATDKDSYFLGSTPTKLAKLDNKLHKAITSGNIDEIKWIFEKLHMPFAGSKLYSKNYGTPWEIACKSGRQAVIELFLTTFEIPKYHCEQLGVGIVTSVIHNHFDVAEYLWGLPVNSKEEMEAPVRNALWGVVAVGDVQQTAFILKRIDFDFKTTGKFKQTMLHNASAYFNEKMIRFILNWQKNIAPEKRVNINWVDERFNCAIDYVASKGTAEIVSLLLEHGSVPAVANKKLTGNHITKPEPVSLINSWAKSLFFGMENNQNCLFNQCLRALQSCEEEIDVYHATIHICRHKAKLDEQSFAQVKSILTVMTYSSSRHIKIKQDTDSLRLKTTCTSFTGNKLIRCLNSVKASITGSQLVDDKQNRLLYIDEPVYYPFDSVFHFLSVPNCLNETEITTELNKNFEVIFKDLYQLLGGELTNFCYQFRTNHGRWWMKVDARVIDFLQQTLLNTPQPSLIVTEALLESDDYPPVPHDIETGDGLADNNSSEEEEGNKPFCISM